MSESALGFLQRWYESQCDTEWEHEFGVKIDTLDNPGWLVTVDLVDTDVEGRILPRFEAGPSPWMTKHCPRSWCGESARALMTYLR